MLNLKKLYPIITFVILALLGMTWDGVFNFNNPNELRIDQSGLFSAIYFFAKGLSGEKLHLGADFMFPYGPMLYWKYNLYWPGLYWYGLVCKYFFLLAFSIALSELYNRKESFKLRQICIIALAAIWTIWLGTDAIYYCYIILLGLIYINNATKVSKLSSFILITELVILSLSKFTFMILAIALMAINLYGATKRKNLLFPLVIYLFVFTIFWFLICKQSLIDIPNYYRSSMELASYFGNAMSLGWLDDATTLVQVIIGILSSLCLLWIVWDFTKSSNRHLSSNSLLIYFVFCIFILFKHGFTRHDAHAAHFSCTLVFVFIFLATYYSEHINTLKNKKIVKYTIFLCILTNFLIVNYWYPVTSDRSFVGLNLRTIYDKSTGLIMAPLGMLHYDSQLHQLFDSRVNEFKVKVGEVPRGATIDAWPDNSALAIFSSGTYSPRPMPFAFSAYSPYLTNANADFINGIKAPDFYIFEVSSIDGHLPTNDDPLSWIALFKNYKIYSIMGDRLLLKKREIKREFVPRDGGSIGAKFDERIDFPRTKNILLIDVKLEKNILGKIVSFIYKLPDVLLTTYNENGVESNFKFVPGISKFIISPQVTDISDAVSIFADMRTDYNLNYINNIKLKSKFSKLFYSNTFKVGYEEVSINKDNHPDNFVYKNKSRNNLLKILRIQKNSQVGVEVSSFNFRDGIKFDALFAHAPSSIDIESNGYQNLALAYGMRPESFHGLDGDGVVFSVMSEDLHGQQKELFSRLLDPAHHQMDQNIFYIKLEIPTSSKKIHLITNPGLNGNTSYDQSFWADIQLK